MSAPEWAKNEQSLDEAKDYLRQGNTVDFFELMSSSILREHPIDLAVFCLELVQKIGDGKEVTTDSEFHPKNVEDNRYMREKNVCDFLNEWILALLKERPTTDIDRIEFHKRYLGSIKVDRGNSNAPSGDATEERPAGSEGSDKQETKNV
ncbi:antigen 2 [Trypanosoma grayi]|uniref:antigen 2 n=1 Tax=Trypanosoma grayi TaxID=71804 RepID=UPI0004F45CF4|nr:antigen 2 [Trypanosoma grayi]KEG13035.1 antigen 2 [Trypanosoma grayi]